jgi:hypothetical protein
MFAVIYGANAAAWLDSGMKKILLSWSSSKDSAWRCTCCGRGVNLKSKGGDVGSREKNFQAMGLRGAGARLHQM